MRSYDVQPLYASPGGIVLHCVFISTKHNPADWPARGDRTSWPAALRRRQQGQRVRPRCPGCNQHPDNHPLHFPKRLRGQQGTYRKCCTGLGGGFAYDFETETWKPFYTLWARHLRDFENMSPTAAAILDDDLEVDGPDEALDCQVVLLSRQVLRS